MADAIAPIGLKVVADLSDFSPKMKTAGDNVGTFADRSKRSLDNVSSAMSSARSAASGFFQGIGQGASGSAFSQATSQIEGLLSKLSSGAGLWGGFAAAGAAAVGVIGAAASATTERLLGLTKLGKTLGTNSQDTQVLLEVFRRAGLDDDSARTSLLRFSGHLGAAGVHPEGAEAGAFRNIGLDPSALQTRSLANAFEQTITALGNIRNRFEQDAAAQSIFGRRFADLEGVIQRPGSFNAARDSVRVGGVTAEVADEASALIGFRRRTQEIQDRNGGSTLQWWSQWWDGFSTRFSTGLARVNRGLVEWGAGNTNAAGEAFGFLPPTRRPDRNPTAIALDVRNKAAEIGATDAERQVGKVLESWRRDVSSLTYTERASAILRRERDVVSPREVGRLAEILQARADNIPASKVEQLEVQNRLATSTERLAAAQTSLTSIVDRTRTTHERFQAALADFDRVERDLHPHGVIPGTFAAFDPRLLALGRARAGAFLDLEKSLGPGPSSYAISGIDPRTSEGARFLADLQVRQTVEDRPTEVRIREVLEGSQEVQRRQLEALGRIDQGLQNLAGLLPAPNF